MFALPNFLRSNNFLITKICWYWYLLLVHVRLGRINCCSTRQGAITESGHEGNEGDIQAENAIFDSHSDGYFVRGHRHWLQFRTIWSKIVLQCDGKWKSHKNCKRHLPDILDSWPCKLQFYISIDQKSIKYWCCQANGTSMGRFEVKRGKNDIYSMGDIVKFNDEEEVDTWSGECNKIKGTDSTM